MRQLRSVRLPLRKLPEFPTASGLCERGDGGKVRGTLRDQPRSSSRRAFSRPVGHDTPRRLLDQAGRWDSHETKGGVRWRKGVRRRRRLKNRGRVRLDIGSRPSDMCASAPRREDREGTAVKTRPKRVRQAEQNGAGGMGSFGVGLHVRPPLRLRDFARTAQSHCRPDDTTARPSADAPLGA